MKKEIKNNRLMKIDYELDILEAMEFTSRCSQLFNFTQNAPLFLSLVVEESLINALEYGSDITIEWSFQKERVVISVKQRGAPFSIEKKDTVNKGPRGRGMQLILNIMDRVWLEQDNDYITLHMEKNTN